MKKDINLFELILGIIMLLIIINTSYINPGLILISLFGIIFFIRQNKKEYELYKKIFFSIIGIFIFILIFSISLNNKQTFSIITHYIVSDLFVILILALVFIFHGLIKTLDLKFEPEKKIPIIKKIEKNNIEYLKKTRKLAINSIFYLLLIASIILYLKKYL